MPVSPGQVVLALTAIVVLAFVWYVEGRGRWRARLEDRLLYGVPWGTLVTVALVVAFYLLAQGGLREWGEPVTMPYITWSYFYPTGQLTAGIAHGSPQHLVSNMTATLAFAPIVEYAWSHYPPEARRDGADDARGSTDGLLANPVVRALVIVPAGLLGVALLTAVFAMGPGLGFSGAVYAIAGFAIVWFPFASVVAILASSTIATVGEALAQPVVTETIDPGPPMPPEWAGIGFQAHMLGFLVGAVLGIALLRARGRDRSLERVFFAALLFGIVQNLWLLVVSGEDVFVRHQAVGVAIVFVLSALVAVGAAGSDRPLLGRFVSADGRPVRRVFALIWLALVALGFLLGLAVAAVTGQPLGPVALGLAMISLLLAVPALPAALRDRSALGPLSRRQAAVALLVVAAVLVAFPSVPLNMMVVDDAGLETDGVDPVEIEDYTVAYGHNLTTGQTPVVEPDPVDGEEAEDLWETEQTGVIVASEDRDIWTIGVSEEYLAYEGNETVVLGGPGWGERLTVERTGWDVVGNDTAYAVDVEHDGETTRTFASDPVRAASQLEGHEVAVVPGEDAFYLEVRSDGEPVGEEAVPTVNETATVGDLEFAAEEVGDGTHLLATTDGGTETKIAAREEYGGEWN